MKYLPFVAGYSLVGKALIASISVADVLALVTILAFHYAYTFIPASTKQKELEKKIDVLQNDIESVKTQVSAVKVATGIRTVNGR